eukprot:CAMPEP_0196579686 /NCGR_PEP_ID=MMETSP1081-20130531/24452_1 /TAXON_ID=36882 /ORGANISM="Pyramimonas amylifera, Strain CCMP720" /LENGTH=189 /DNA_ID=CAMNT_0041899339 /DNA_START=165 /DNA_END=734 /DNA_ORIENTATION=+
MSPLEEDGDKLPQAPPQYMTPPVSWAQRRDRLYLTVEVSECAKPQVRLQDCPPLAGTDPSKQPHCVLEVKGMQGAQPQKPFLLQLDLYGNIDIQESRVGVGPRALSLVLLKETPHAGVHWPRLLRPEGRPPKGVKVDWDKWKDEEDEDKEKNAKEFDVGDLDDMHKFDEFADEELDSEGENDNLSDTED